MTWPPTLDDVKGDLGIELTDTRDDGPLEARLAAAVAFVERVRPEFRYDLTQVDQVELPMPDADTWLGTILLASRWHARRRSPAALIEMGELGSARVPSFDPDIDRLLRLGRHVKPGVG